jgi:stage II sporulation protein R
MKTIAALSLFVLLCAAVLSALPVHGEAEIYDSVIRLHVLAASDSAEDQADKLAVRDALLPVAAEGLADCATRAEAAARLEALLPTLEERAEETLRLRGAEASVTVELGQERYPTRAYEGFCFPSGEYLSLRVLIGEGEGQNWWCVLFPSLCLSVAEGGRAEEMEEAFISVGLTPEQYRIITESDEHVTYRMRFKFLEALEKWHSSLTGRK